jgi:secreted trypsin-like serine protease
MQALSDKSDYPSIPIEEKVIHPLYGAVGYSYDAMIMKLATPSNEQYIRLNLNTSIPVQDETLWVVGFGDTAASEKKQELATVLNEVDVQYVSTEQCAMEYGENLIHDDMLCAAGDGKDSW